MQRILLGGNVWMVWQQDWIGCLNPTEFMNATTVMINSLDKPSKMLQQLGFKPVRVRAGFLNFLFREMEFDFSSFEMTTAKM